jgi:hypothetical protein
VVKQTDTKLIAREVTRVFKKEDLMMGWKLGKECGGRDVRFEIGRLYSSKFKFVIQHRGPHNLLTSMNFIRAFMAQL